MKSKENNVKETSAEESFTVQITVSGAKSVLHKLKTIFSADQQTVVVSEDVNTPPGPPLPWLESKMFWKTSELKPYGFGRRTLNTLVKQGKLTRYDLGGSAGFQYISSELINLTKVL